MKNKGFTLAELLIALAILGVIATFTIPKVLNTAGNGQNTAIAKEVAGMISGAQQAFTQQNGAPVTGTTPGNFTTFMNYVRFDTSNTATSAGVGANCVAATPCLRLHNGGVLQYATANSFGSTHNTASVNFNLDPDDGGAATPVTFAAYLNGRLTTGQFNIDAASTGAAGEVNTDPSYIQSWN